MMKKQNKHCRLKICLKILIYKYQLTVYISNSMSRKNIAYNNNFLFLFAVNVHNNVNIYIIIPGFKISYLLTVYVMAVYRLRWCPIRWRGHDRFRTSGGRWGTDVAGESWWRRLQQTPRDHVNKTNPYFRISSIFCLNISIGEKILFHTW